MADFTDLVREDVTQKNLAALMKAMLQHTTMPTLTKQQIESKIDDITGERKFTEHSRKADNFKFETPHKDLEEWKTKLRKDFIDPKKDIHYRTEFGVSYANYNTDSYTKDPDVEALAAVEALIRDHDERETEREKDYNRTDPNYDENDPKARTKYIRRELSQKDLDDRHATHKSNTFKDNIIAKLQNPEWVVLKRTQANDTMYEDKELRFKETDSKIKKDENRETDWAQNIQNISDLGRQLGYTEKHYKNVLSRFISWFSPELTLVTENLTANEIAVFLLKLNMPDTPKEKIRKQLENLSRKPGQQLRHVMAYLYEIAKELYKDRTAPEQEHEIRQTMLTGLLRFTDQPLRTDIAKAIKWSKERDMTLDWKSMLDKTIDKETVHGTPSTELKFKQQNTEAIRDYNVNYKPNYKPATTPKHAPGKGGQPYWHEDIEVEDDPLHLGGYPSNNELYRAIRRSEPAERKQSTKSIADIPLDRRSETASPESPKYYPPAPTEKELDDDDETFLDTVPSPEKPMTIVKPQTDNKPVDSAFRASGRVRRSPERFSPTYATATTDKTDNNQPRNSQNQRQWRDRTRSNDRNNRRNSGNHNRERTPDRRRDSDRQSRQTKTETEEEIRRRHRSGSLEAKKLAQAGARMNQTKPDARPTDRNRTASRGRESDSKTTSRSNYSSSDRNTSRQDRSQSRGRERDRNFDRNNGPRNPDRQTGTAPIIIRDPSHDRIESMRGITFDKDYDRNKTKECNKCGLDTHHPFDCRKYKRHSLFSCQKCAKNLRHWAEDCKERPRDRTPDRNQYTPRDRTPDRNRYTQRDRTPDRNQYTQRDRTPDRNQYTQRSRTPDRNHYTPRDRTPDRNQYTQRDRTPDRNQYTQRGRTPDRNQYTPRGRTPDRQEYTPRAETTEKNQYSQRDRTPTRTSDPPQTRTYDRKDYSPRPNRQDQWTGRPRDPTPDRNRNIGYGLRTQHSHVCGSENWD